MTQRNALVTGANKGIGLSVARSLAGHGYHVWMGCRDLARGEAAVRTLGPSGDVTPVEIDVTDPQSIARAVHNIGSVTDTLDVLVNNAGIFTGSVPFLETKLSDLQQEFAVNVFGTISVTQAFAPFLDRADIPRIVTVSSQLGSLTNTANGQEPPMGIAYPASKAALNMVTILLARHFGDRAKVNACCPGFTATDLHGLPSGRGPDQGSKIVVKLAMLDQQGPTGQFFNDAGPITW